MPRRAAAARAPSLRSSCPPALGPRAIRPARRVTLGGTRAKRAACERRDAAAAGSGHGRRADAAGASGGDARGRGSDESRGRRRAVPQPEDDRGAPRPHLQEAARSLAHGRPPRCWRAMQARSGNPCSSASPRDRSGVRPLPCPFERCWPVAERRTEDARVFGTRLARTCRGSEPCHVLFGLAVGVVADSRGMGARFLHTRRYDPFGVWLSWA